MTAPTLTVAESLSLFDQASQLRQEEGEARKSPAQIAEAFQAVSQAQGLPVTAAFAARVVARAQVSSAPVVVPWKRPASHAAWLAERAQLQQASAHYQKWENRIGLGALGGIALGVLGCVGLVVKMSPRPLPLALAEGLMAGLLFGIFAGFGLIGVIESLPAYHREKKRALRIKQLEEATLGFDQVKAFAEVPGLASQLGAILHGEVPLLALDLEAAKAAVRAHQEAGAAVAERAKEDRRLADDQAAKAWLRAQYAS